ncbi:MAG: ISKra4 family transposase [Planctomycetota bacterium]
MSAPILVEIPAKYKTLAEAIGELVVAVDVRCKTAGNGNALDYLCIEDELREHSSAIERGAHEAVLSSAVIDTKSLRIGAKVYGQACRSMGSYKTQAGVVRIERPLCREKGVRNGPTIDAISIRIGAVGDGWLPGTAKSMTHLLQLGTSREAANVACQVGRLPYSRTSFERVPHAVGEIYVGQRVEIEEKLICEFVVPDEARSVSASIDRVSIPMEEPRPRPRGRPAKNAPKNPITRQYRMAYCATVTLHDGDGRAIHTIRYGRMPQGDEWGLADALGSDVLAILRQRPDLAVVRLADGAHDMWSLLETGVDDVSIGKKCTSLIDFWHLIEKLSAAAKELYGTDGQKVVDQWRKKLATKPRAAAEILATLRDDAGLQPGHEADPVRAAITYLENHADRMNYSDARKRGLPIGSGNVEATCKTLVQMRMKRAGSRWKEDSGDHVMQLRALALSDRWDGAMNILFRSRCQEARAVAA